MKLDEFISKVLVDIHNGLGKAKAETDRDCYVRNIDSGVIFDVAVTTANSQGSQTEGKTEANARAGIIEVVAAKLSSTIGSKTENRTESSEVSRIKFEVFFPTQTETERIEERHRSKEQSKDYSFT